MGGLSEANFHPVFGALMACLSAQPALAASYRYITLDPPGTQFREATAINDAGQVLIQADGGRGFVWKAGVFTPVVAPAGQSLFSLTGISPWGLVIGTTISRANETLGFAFSTLRRRAYSLNIRHRQTFPAAINAMGQVTGETYLKHDEATAFIYRYGDYVLLHPPGSTQSFGTWINDAGQVVGREDRPNVAFSYFGGHYETLTFPDAIDVVPLYVNSAGDIAGFYDTLFFSHGFIRSKGVYRIVDDGSSRQNVLLSVNTRGDAIGASSSLLFGLFRGRILPINPVPNILFSYASAGCLNEFGHFAGSYQITGGISHAFVAICDSPDARCTP